MQKGNKDNRKGWTGLSRRRAIALVMAFFMVFSLILPGGSTLSNVYADTYVNPQLVELAANNIDVTLADPAQNINRDSQFGIYINYTIPHAKLDAAKAVSDEGKIIWVYDLTEFIGNNPLQDLVDLSEGQAGNITQGTDIRGRYTISGNKVYLDVDKDWLLTQDAEVKGTFELSMSLDAEKVGSSDEVALRFPGAKDDFTLSFSTPSSSTNAKSVTGAEGNHVAVTPNGDGTYDVKYQVSVKPNTYHDSAFNVIDTLTSTDQSFDTSSFSVSYNDTLDSWKEKTVDLTSYVSVSGQSATIDLFQALKNSNAKVVADTEYRISYTTKVDAGALGEELVNKVKTTWESGGTTGDTTTTITPVSSITVDKSYTKIDDNTYTYTITVGDSSTDMSNVVISDYMNDLQKLTGSITVNGTVLDTYNSEFKDNTYADTEKNLFSYNTGDGFGMGPVVIEYQVKLPDSKEAPNIFGNKNINNRVTATGQNREGKDSTSFQHSFDVPGTGTVDKSFVAFDTDNNRVQWSIAVTNTGTTDLIDAYITDTTSANSLENEYYFDTGRSAVDWTTVVIKDGTGATLATTDYSVDNTNRKISFAKIPAGATYTVTLSTYPSAGDLTDGVSYKNDVGLYNQYDALLGNDSDQKKFSLNKTSVEKTVRYDEEKQEYEWTVVVNKNESAIDPDRQLYFTDTIPTGMEYVTGSMVISCHGKSTLDGKDYWDFAVTDNGEIELSINNNVIGPVDVSKAFNNHDIYNGPYAIGTSGLATTVKYRTKLTAAEKEAVKGTEDTRHYTNVFNVTDSSGNTSYGTDSETADHTYKFLTKKDLSPGVIDNTDKDIINFRIDVNEDALTLNEGNDLILEDVLKTNIELITSGFAGKYGFTVEDAAGKDLLASGDATLSYNDDSRKITVTVPDAMHVIVRYSVRTRQTGDIQVDNEAILIGGGKQHSDGTSENHKVSSHSATIQGGGIQLHKIDEHNITKGLPGAIFKLYTVPFDPTTFVMGNASLVDTGDITSTDGYYSIKEEFLEEGKLYYWQETKAPTGYQLDDTPHYFAVYDGKVAGSYDSAKAVDNKIQDANPGVIVNTIELGNYTWTVCNRKGNVVGDLAITKELTVSGTTDAAVITKVKDQAFDVSFTLTAPASATIPATVSAEITKTGAVARTVTVALNQGKGTISLKDGETATITGLPDGTTAVVTETKDTALETKGYAYDAIAAGTGYSENIVQNTVAEVTIGNSYTMPKTSVMVTKKWDGDTSFSHIRPASVDVQLKNGNTNVGQPVSLTAATNWTYTWSDLPKYDADLNEISYSVAETAATVTALEANYNAGQAVTVQDTTVDHAYEITNTAKTGDLAVSKMVSSPVASDSQHNFTFSVTLDDTAIEGTFGGMNFVQGVATFTLKDTESIEATGLPAGIGYTVAETGADDFNVAFNPGATGTISGTKSTVSVTNTRKTGRLVVNKNFVLPTGTTVPATAYYALQFQLKRQGIVMDTFTYMNIYQALSVNKEGYEIMDLPLADDYELVETNADGLLATYNLVLDEANSDVNLTGIKIEDGKEKKVTLTNTYKALQGGIALKAKKTVDGQVPAAGGAYDGKFTFQLQETTTATVPDRLSTALTKTNVAGDITFDAISYTAPAVHTYQITESPVAAAMNMDGDATQYFVTVTVTEDTTDKSKLNAAVTGVTKKVSGGAETVVSYADGAGIAFDNTRKTTSLTVSKSVVSTFDFDHTQAFYFTVTLSDTSINGTYGEMTFKNGVAEIKLEDRQSKTASGLPVGVDYTVTEKEDSKFDSACQSNTGTTDIAGNTVHFINTRLTGDLVVKKKVVSDISRDHDRAFDFKVTTVSNINGTFGGMTFTNGVAEFSLKDTEQCSATGLPAGCSYLVEESAVSGFVTTYQNQSGSIVEGTTTVTVTNTKSLQPANYALGAKKTADGLKADDFGFRLERVLADGTADSTFTPVTAKNAADGTVDFGVTFTSQKEETAYYHIYETDVASTTTVSPEDGYYIRAVTTADRANDTYVVKLYRFAENAVPGTGFAVETNWTEVQAGNPAAFTFENVSTMQIQKKDSDGLLAGAELEIYEGATAEGNAVQSFTSGTTAVTVTGLKYNTVYTLHEAQTPNQDYLEAEDIYFMIRPDGVYQLADATDTVGTKVNNGLLTMIDTKRGEVLPKDIRAKLKKSHTDIYGGEVKLSAGEYEFTMTALSYGGVLDQDTTRVPRTVQNAADGTVTFGPMTYLSTDVGKAYAYLVNETKPSADTVSMDMDETRYILVVTVNKVIGANRDYELELVKQWYKAPTGTEADIIPENRVDEADVKLVNKDRSGILKITKTIKGDVTPEEAAGQLQFTVTDEDGNVLVVKDGTSEKKLEKLILAKDFTKVGDVYELELKVPAGQKYVVSEVIYDVEGAVLAQVTGNGTALEKKDGIYSMVTDTVQPGTTPTAADYENTYKKGKLVITKTIKGDVTPEEAAGQLEFTITNETTGKKEVVNLSKFTFDKTTGVYTYEIDARPGDVYSVTETDYDVDGSILESVTHRIKGGDAEDGATASGIVISSTEQSGVDFEDDYKADEGVIHFSKFGYTGELCSDTPDAIRELEGVTFRAEKTDDAAVYADATSDSKGRVVFEKLPAGTYKVYEIDVPEDVVLDETVYYATISKATFEGITDEDGNKIEKGRIINEVYRADIEFTKVSEEDTGEVLSGSTYELYRVMDDRSEKKIAEAVTDKNGKIVFKGVLTGVQYRVKEVESPDGYYVSRNPIHIGFKVVEDTAGKKKVVVDEDVFDDGDETVTVDENGNITWLEPEVMVSVSKVDQDGVFVSGATLRIEDMDGNVVIPEWVSKDETHTISGKLIVGHSYKLVEVKAPDGYEIAGAVTFSIPDDEMKAGENKPIELKMIDKKKSKSGKPKTPDTPTTSDDTPLLPVAGLMVLSLAGVVIVGAEKRKLKRNKKKK